MNKFQIIKKMVGAPVIALALMLFAAGCEDSHPDNISSSEDIVAVSAAQQVYPLTIRATKDAWKAASDVEWIQLSRMEAIGTRDIELIIAENTSDALRTGHVTVMINDNVKQIITVKQAGKGDTDVRVTPQLITAGAYSDAYSFTLEVKDKLASSGSIITGVEYLVSTGWIKDLKYTDVELAGGHLLRTYTFTLEDNEMANAREAAVNLTVKYGHSVYERTVKIYQNGLGTPAVATVENIYVRHNQTEHKQTVWLNDGDDSNVIYQVYRTSSQSGNETTDPADAWIADAQIAGNELVLTFKKNKVDEIREGDIYIIASRGNYNDYASTAKLRVHVTQSAHQSAGISMPVAEVAHNYAAFTYTMPVQPINSSQVNASVLVDVDWITNVAINNNTELTYTLTEYRGGQIGDFREATVTMTAANGNANKAEYYMKVRQYAPELPAISDLPQYIGLGSQAQSGKLLMNVADGTTVTVIAAPAWVTAPAVGNTLTSELNYTVTANTAAATSNTADYFRDGVITLKATNAHKNAAYYYVTVRQYGRDLAYVTSPTLAYSWNANLAQGNNSIASRSNYSPLQNTGWVTSLANLPGMATVKTKQNNDIFKFTADNASGFSWMTIPKTYDWTEITTTTKSTIMTIEVNAAPYFQTLTVTATATQKAVPYVAP